ncbi:MAG: hypothetical protein HN337_00580 [Deltaproteobacteria bacterium]|nr:hypothetical protein [Deltaproteobacteria bacterium]
MNNYKYKLLILAVLVLCVSCRSTAAPVPPADIPQTIEYMGKSTSTEYLGVETMKSLNFAVKDASGNLISPDLVTATLLGIDGNPVSGEEYGDISISDDGQYVQFTAPESFFSFESQEYIAFDLGTSASVSATASKTSTDDEFTFKLAVSAGVEQISGLAEALDFYSYRDFDMLGTYSYGAPRITVDENGNSYVLMKNLRYDDGSWFQGDDIVLMKAYLSNESGTTAEVIQNGDLLKVVDNGAWRSSYNIGEYAIAVFDQNTYAVTYSYTDYSDLDNKNSALELVTTSDGGTSWSDPIPLRSYDVIDFSDSDIAYDSEGRLHIIYSTDYFDADVYYLNCMDGMCSDTLKLNTQDETATNIFSSSKPRILISDDGGDALKIFAAWAHFIDAQGAGYTRFNEIEYDRNGQTATLINSLDVQSYTEGLAYSQYMTMDGNGVPIVAWAEAQGNLVDPSAYYLRMARYEGGIMTADTVIREYSVDSDEFPAKIYADCDYSNNVHIISFEADKESAELGVASYYDVATYDTDTEIYSMLDTIFGSPAPAVIETYDPPEDFFRSDAANDSAGRSFISHFNDDSGMINLTIGTIWK